MLYYWYNLQLFCRVWGDENERLYHNYNSIFNYRAYHEYGFWNLRKVPKL